MAINQSFLAQKSANYQETLYKSAQFSASAGRVKSAFLCHSHKDEILVKGLIAYFQEKGIDLYIDWKDHSMPDTPNIMTAKKIQEAINSRELFLFLATSNSKASRWCPWEIGYADSSKRMIYIIPTTDGSGTYGNEYLQLYSKIDYKDGFQPVLYTFNAGNTIGKWLNSGAML